MSRPRKSDGRAGRQRQKLARADQRKRLHVELRPKVYAKLLQMVRVDDAGRAESLVQVVERTILSANEQLLPPQTEFVQTRTFPSKRAA